MIAGYVFMMAMIACDFILLTSSGDPSAGAFALGVVFVFAVFVATACAVLLPFRYRGYRLMWGWRDATGD